jgi:hypothetical protein
MLAIPLWKFHPTPWCPNFQADSGDMAEIPTEGPPQPTDSNRYFLLSATALGKPAGKISGWSARR